jgi:hypothetical protein
VDIATINAIPVVFCDFKKNWWFFKLRAIMWWFFGINSVMAGDCVWRIVDVACIREVTFSLFRISFHSSVLLKKNITVHYILETSNLDIDLSIIFSPGQKTTKRVKEFLVTPMP